MLADFIGGWELALIVSVFAILLLAKRLPSFFRDLGDGFAKGVGEAGAAGFGKPVADALTPGNQTVEVPDPAALREGAAAKRKMFSLILWVAQGCGIGRLKPGPGTWGSVLGLGWFAALLATGSLAWFVLGAVAAVLASVWFCGAAEKILGQKDPGSVVLDEIAALPFCFAGWVGTHFFQTGQLPAPAHFFSAENWLQVVFIFGAFRFFDIVKPWPVKQSQSLPGGWGVTVDDVLAAGYVNAAWALLAWLAPGR